LYEVIAEAPVSEVDVKADHTMSSRVAVEVAALVGAFIVVGTVCTVAPTVFNEEYPPGPLELLALTLA
jgi:hypothetical protein